MRKELNLMARTKHFIEQSAELMSESEKLTADWQKLIDDQTAKMLKRISVRLRRKGQNCRV